MPSPRTYKLAGAVALLALLGLGLARAGLLAEVAQVAHLGPVPAGTAIELAGNIEAHESQLSFKSVQSRVVELPFDEGQWVKRGSLVAVVDSSDLRQQVSVADAVVAVQQRQLASARENLVAARSVVDADRADMAQRELDLARERDLQQQGLYSEAALDAVRTALLVSRAALARDLALARVAERNIQVTRAGAHSAEESAHLARIVAGYATLAAPFDGVILARQAELGEVVAPGTPIVTMADLDHVWVRAYLNETDLGRIRLGQAAGVSADAWPGRRFAGRVSFISSQAEYTPKSVETHAERVTLVYRVKIDIDNPEHLFVPGMPVDVSLAAVPK